MFTLFFLIIFSEPLNSGLQLQNVVVNQNGVFLGSDAGVYHQTLAGDVVAKLNASPFDQILPFDTGYLVKDAFSLELHFFTKDGELIETFDNISWRHVSMLSDHLVATTPRFYLPNNLEELNKDKKTAVNFGPFLKKYDQGRNPNPFMIDLVRLAVKDGSIEFFLENSFFRATEEQKSFNLNYKKTFILPFENSYYIMTEMNEKLYLYDEKTIQAERSTDPLRYFEKPSFQLELEGFVSVRDNPVTLKPIYFDKKERSRDRLIQMSSFSRVLDFSKTEFGFLITYSVPSKSDEPTNHVDIFVQEVDMNGQNRGVPTIFENRLGWYAGMANGDLYWFSTEPGKRTGRVEVLQLD